MTRATESYGSIKGWFNEIDVRCFAALMETQQDAAPGDLVEIGACQGKSAVIIGDYLREGERFVVVDLFGDKENFDDTSEGAANLKESKRSYPRLTRELFETNYLAVHDQLPVVVQGFSSEIVDHVEPHSARFIHVDGSHHYHVVKTDCQSAKLLTRPGGVVSFDDYRNQSWPGVGAAIWESVVTDGLIPFATTRKKLYGCYDDPTPHLETLRAMIRKDRKSYDVNKIEVMGHTLLRIGFSKKGMQQLRSED